MRNVSDISCRKYNSAWTFFFRKSYRLRDNVKKYCTARQATDDITSQADCMLRLQIHTLRLCNTHCCFTASMVARTSLNVTLYVHCLSCFLFRHTVMEAASLVSFNSFNIVRYGSKKCSSCRTVFMLLLTAGPECCNVTLEQTSRICGTAKYGPAKSEVWLQHHEIGRDYFLSRPLHN